MNKTVKLLFYCTKAKPYLGFNDLTDEFCLCNNLNQCDYDYYNGKIVAESECELVEKIKFINDIQYGTNTLNQNDLLKESCIGMFDLYEYLFMKDGYAIHLKNVKPFEIPKELSDYSLFEPNHCIYRDVKKAPQNMCRIVLEDCPFASPKEEYVIISIKPEWLCKILNGEKTIEVRTSILNALKELIENESKRLF